MNWDGRLAKVEYLAGGIILIAIATFAVIHYFDMTITLLEYSEYSTWTISDAIATLDNLRGLALFGVALGVIGRFAIGWGAHGKRRLDTT
jgi:uncharacterized membrane protein YcfT